MMYNLIKEIFMQKNKQRPINKRFVSCSQTSVGENKADKNYCKLQEICFDDDKTAER